MKKTMKIYMAAALLAVVSPAILAQAPVKVVCNELKQKGNELVIDAVITVDGSQIKSRENLSLTPVLESASQKEGLPSILLNGRISQKVYDREIALNNLQDEPRFLVVQAGKTLTACILSATFSRASSSRARSEAAMAVATTSAAYTA